MTTQQQTDGGNSVNHEEVDRGALIEARVENLEEMVDSWTGAEGKRPDLAQLREDIASAKSATKRRLKKRVDPLEAEVKRLAGEVTRLTTENEQLGKGFEALVERLEGMHKAIEAMSEEEAAE